MEQACKEMGLSMTTAFTMFASKVSREKRIPFEVSVAPFYSESNIIKDIQRGAFDGIGKPEPLKGNMRGWWSRRIDETNRIVYCEKEDAIIIHPAKDIIMVKEQA